MSQIGPIPIRFSPEIVKRLEAAAAATGLETKTAVVKLCVANFLDFFEKHGPSGLALNWKDMLRETDGRVTRFRNIKVQAHQAVVGGGVINNHVMPVAKHGKRKQAREEKP